MKTAMASGEIFVGYEKALYSGPVLADGSGAVKALDCFRRTLALLFIESTSPFFESSCT